MHSKPVSINLRRANGSAFVMKSLREPMVVVMKLTGQEVIGFGRRFFHEQTKKQQKRELGGVPERSCLKS